MVKKVDVDSAMNRIINCRTKWGTGSSATFKPTAGSTIVKAVDVNNMSDWLVDVKKRSGYTGGTQGHVSAGSKITNVWAAMKQQADAVYAHCKCNCNHCSCNCNHCKCNCDNCGCGGSCSRNNN